MKNEFFKFSSRRILFSTVMASALLAGSPQTVFAEVNGVQTVMQTGTVKGQVVDATGEPVIGATVQVKGTTNGTITDFDGNFTLNNVPEKGILVISYIGYKTQEVNISGKTNVKVVLKEDTEVLDEVVVVGYGAQKKASLTSSISQIKGCFWKVVPGRRWHGRFAGSALPCSGCRNLILPCSCSASSPVIRWEQACSVR